MQTMGCKMIDNNANYSSQLFEKSLDRCQDMQKLQIDLVT